MQKILSLNAERYGLRKYIRRNFSRIPCPAANTIMPRLEYISVDKYSEPEK